MLKLFNPNFFIKISNKCLPWLMISMVLAFSYGIYLSIFASPPDYQQGEMVRIMYVHVPAAWMSLGVYSFVAACSISSLVWRTRLSYLLAISAAPVGAAFSLITLVTGSLWGKPIWGTWWVWDARLTSMLVLFLLYVSYILVVNAGDDIYRAEKPAAAIALVGVINVPIVKFSVDIWYSLHQPASVFKLEGPSVHPSMLKPLAVMFTAYVLYFLVILLMRTNYLLFKLKIFIEENK